ERNLTVAQGVKGKRDARVSDPRPRRCPGRRPDGRGDASIATGHRQRHPAPPRPLPAPLPPRVILQASRPLPRQTQRERMLQLPNDKAPTGALLEDYLAAGGAPL